ncbi:MAG: helix-hairpin-helix domain-containing protein [Desulfobacterales bacterium]|nr:MAG: helix-hairpin-helix domain-containing protein [Desulfobacterales bacterium]
MKKAIFGIPVLLAVFVLLLSGVSVYAGDVAKIDINKASAEELTQLKGVGPSIAAKIVEYRDKNGPFKNPEDITMVSGIGAKTYENNKDVIVVE